MKRFDNSDIEQGSDDLTFGQCVVIFLIFFAVFYMLGTIYFNVKGM